MNLALHHLRENLSHNDIYKSSSTESKEGKKKKKVQWGSCTECLFHTDECPTECTSPRCLLDNDINKALPIDFFKTQSIMEVEGEEILTAEQLPKSEEYFLLRKFQECLEESFIALSQISEVNTPRETEIIFTDSSSQNSNQKSTASLQSKEEAKKSKLQEERKNLHNILKRLNSLSHECSNQHSSKSIFEEDGCEKHCDCQGFNALIVQSLFETKYLAPQNVINYLLNFYGNIEKIPFKILYLGLNGIIKKGQLEEAYKILTYCLEPKTIESSTPTLTNDNELNHNDNNDEATSTTSTSLSTLPSKSAIDLDKYESLLQLLLFHVVPPLRKYDVGFAYIEKETLLPSWKVDAFKMHLTILRGEVASSGNTSHQNQGRAIKNGKQEEQSNISSMAIKSTKTEENLNEISSNNAIQPPQSTPLSQKEKFRENSKAVTSTGWSLESMVKDYLFGLLRKLQTFSVYQLLFSSSAIVSLLFMIYRKITSSASTKNKSLFNGKSSGRRGKLSENSSASNMLTGVVQLLSSLFSMGRPTI